MQASAMLWTFAVLVARVLDVEGAENMCLLTGAIRSVGAAWDTKTSMNWNFFDKFALFSQLYSDLTRNNEKKLSDPRPTLGVDFEGHTL